MEHKLMTHDDWADWLEAVAKACIKGMPNTREFAERLNDCLRAEVRNGPLDMLIKFLREHEECPHMIPRIDCGICRVGLFAMIERSATETPSTPSESSAASPADHPNR